VSERERINEKKRERVLVAEEKRVIGLFSALKTLKYPCNRSIIREF